MSEIQPPPAAPTPVPTPAPGLVKVTNGLATAGFILGLIGLLGSFIPVINVVGIFIGVVGAILAVFGLVKANKSGVGKGLAITGLILGVLAVIIGVTVNVIFAAAVSESVDQAIVDITVGTPTGSADGTATDSSTPSDAAAADAAIGTSRDNPAPLGSAITDGDWTVTINSVTTADADSLGQTPQAGSTLLVINMTATYTGTDSQGATAWATVDFVTAEGTTIGSLDGSSYFAADESFDSLTTLYEGGSVTGNQILEVPADSWESGVLAVSPALLSFADDTFVAVQ